MGRKGALVFKGDSKRKSSKEKRKLVEAEESASVSTPNVPIARTGSSQPQVKSGTGTITTSGSVVTGHGTRFMTELGVGDALLVHVSTPEGDSNQEMRIITMRLSDVSLNVSSAFSSSLSSPVSFEYVPKPRNYEREAVVALERQAQTQRDEMRHNGSNGANDELVYRERTEHGNYRTKRVKVATSNGDTTDRSDLLALRTKKTSDKYC